MGSYGCSPQFRAAGRPSTKIRSVTKRWVGLIIRLISTYANFCPRLSQIKKYVKLSDIQDTCRNSAAVGRSNIQESHLFIRYSWDQLAAFSGLVTRPRQIFYELDWPTGALPGCDARCGDLTDSWWGELLAKAVAMNKTQTIKITSDKNR